jgi:beta-N-acetylhexosaminidase
VRDVVRRAGQRFMVGFRGQAVSTDLKTLVRELGVGSVVLFAHNVESPEQLADLVREVQSLARDAGHDSPLLLAVDQEGGRVARLRPPWTAWPALREVGRAGSEELARRMGEGLALELHACGIRWDLAPVVDVDTNPHNPVINDRSFGDDPDLVARLGAAMAQGLQQKGVAACAKHFPGHGDTDVDSHEDLPAVDHGRSRLDDVELRPFRAAVAAGVAAVMTAHVVCRELNDLPATLSRVVLRGVLRGEMGFGGVVVSDDMEMKAITRYWSPGAAAVLAAGAGCDLIAISAGTDGQVASIEAVIRALESGELPRKEAEDSERRLRSMKERWLLPYRDPDPRAAREAAGALERTLVAREIAERAGAAWVGG